jgi:hypothetical protein
MNKYHGVESFIRCFFAVPLLAVALLNASAAPASGTDQDWITETVTSQFAKFKSVAILPSKKDRTIVAAYCENDPQWWGHLRVFKHKDDKVEWAAVFPHEYLGSDYVVSYQWLSLGMLDNDVLEIIGSTQLGNGSLWLFELNGRELRPLLNIPVRGRYWNPGSEFAVPDSGEASFAGDHLKVEYQKEPISKFESVVLTGTVSIIDMTGKELPSKPYLQQCTWNENTRIFIPGVVHAISSKAAVPRQ